MKKKEKQSDKLTAHVQFNRGCGFTLNLEPMDWRYGEEEERRQVSGLESDSYFTNSSLLIPDALSAGTKKKHKKNKRKHCTVEVPSPQGEDVPTHRPIKLKIKLGDQLISSSDATM